YSFTHSFFFLLICPPPTSTLFPYTTLFRSRDLKDAFRKIPVSPLDYFLLLFKWNNQTYIDRFLPFGMATSPFIFNMFAEALHWIDRKSTRLNSSHLGISYAVFCLKKKKKNK